MEPILSEVVNEISPPALRPGASSAPRARGARRQSWFQVLLVAAGLALAAPLVYPPRPWPRTSSPPSAAAPAYVDDRSCAPCHRAQHEAWVGSHHAKAMQVATEATVLGDFKDATLTHLGVTTRFFRRAGRFFVNTEGPDGTPADFEVAYTFGVAPLQQYLIELPGGRLQSLTIAWDTSGRQWFPLYPRPRIAPDDPLHWTGRYQNWNLMCAECHTTDLRKGYDPKADTYATRWAAINVGCQACHGPGQAHLAWAQAGRSRGGGTSSGGAGTGLVVDLKGSSAGDLVDACARCHSRRTRLASEERAGRPFLDEYRPEALRPDLYHADGQPLDEVYEYGSYRQSAMSQQGVRCTDCHDAHTGSLRASGNALCTGCHGERPDPRFPALKPKAYDTPAHHFHRARSAAAACVSCHMPAKNYMVVHARRDHSMRVPRPDLSVALRTPNACSGCHADRSPEWAAATIVRWYGPRHRPHFGETIAAGRAGSREAEPRLAALAGDRTQPAIVRATALELLRGYGAAGLEAMVAALKDEDAAVRLAAVGGLDRLPPRERVTVVAPLLADARRAVRIEAARVLAPVPPELLDASRRQALDAALKEFTDAQMAMIDMPSTHLNLGVLHAARGEHERAEQSYLTALRMDPYLASARVNLAVLYSERGRPRDAERVLREGIQRTPEQGELHYSLGLLLAESKRLSEAASTLRDAARLLPDRARVRYNLGLALQQLGRPGEAEAALLQAHQLDGGDESVLYALTVFYAQQVQYARALPYAERLVERRPADPAARRLLERVRDAAR